MALDLEASYPGQVEAADANYPYGGAKNETVVDALDGTPYEKAMANDIFGFQQRLLSVAEIVPSGNSETALISQYLEALQLFMSQLQNYVINGTGVVQQRPDYTLVKDAYDFGPDRFAGMATGTLVSAGTLTQTDSANVGVTGFAHEFNQVTLTGTGVLFHRIRIESKDAKNLKNLKASLGCKVYHNVGSAVDYTLTVRKADAEDDFSSTTDISNDGGTSVDSATATELKFEDITMGDCSNGIEIELQIECGAVTLKDFEQTEYQLEVGTVVTPFKPEVIEGVIAACQRYYSKSYDLDKFAGDTTVSTGFRQRALGSTLQGEINFNVQFPVRMREAPTIVMYATTSGTAGNMRDTTAGANKVAVAANIGEFGFQMYNSGTVTTSNWHEGHYTADAEL